MRDMVKPDTDKCITGTLINWSTFAKLANISSSKVVFAGAYTSALTDRNLDVDG